jgi:deoxycytidine triphosphate deaminase
MVYIGEGIGELTFLESDEITDRMYSGKYQNQEGLQCPKI